MVKGWLCKSNFCKSNTTKRKRRPCTDRPSLIGKTSIFQVSQVFYGPRFTARGSTRGDVVTRTVIASSEERRFSRFQSFLYGSRFTARGRTRGDFVIRTVLASLEKRAFSSFHQVRAFSRPHKFSMAPSSPPEGVHRETSSFVPSWPHWKKLIFHVSFGFTSFLWP